LSKTPRFRPGETGHLRAFELIISSKPLHDDCIPSKTVVLLIAERFRKRDHLVLVVDVMASLTSLMLESKRQQYFLMIGCGDHTKLVIQQHHPCMLPRNFGNGRLFLHDGFRLLLPIKHHPQHADDLSIRSALLPYSSGVHGDQFVAME